MKTQLELGEINVGISTVPISGEEIEWYPVFEEEILLAVPLSHPLAKRKRIYLQEVENDSFIVMSAGYGFRDMTENFCTQAGFYPHFAFEGDETGVTYELVEKGLGVAFIPDIIRSKKISFLKIAKLRITEPKCKRTVGVVWHKRSQHSEIVKDFIAYTIAFLEQIKLERIQENND